MKIFMLALMFMLLASPCFAGEVRTAGVNELFTVKNAAVAFLIVVILTAMGVPVLDKAREAIAKAKTTTGGMFNADELVKNRAASLKTACPKAEPELRLKWLEQGLDDNRARVDYIAVLEAKLSK